MFHFYIKEKSKSDRVIDHYKKYFIICYQTTTTPCVHTILFSNVTTLLRILSSLFSVHETIGYTNLSNVNTFEQEGAGRDSRSRHCMSPDCPGWGGTLRKGDSDGSLKWSTPHFVSIELIEYFIFLQDLKELLFLFMLGGNVFTGLGLETCAGILVMQTSKDVWNQAWRLFSTCLTILSDLWFCSSLWSGGVFVPTLAYLFVKTSRGGVFQQLGTRDKNSLDPSLPCTLRGGGSNWAELKN